MGFCAPLACIDNSLLFLMFSNPIIPSHVVRQLPSLDSVSFFCYFDTNSHKLPVNYHEY